MNVPGPGLHFASFGSKRIKAALGRISRDVKLGTHQLLVRLEGQLGLSRLAAEVRFFEKKGFASVLAQGKKHIHPRG